MWNLKYVPDSGKARCPRDEILAFGNPLSGIVLNKLELFSTKKDHTEWGGSCKYLKNNKARFKWMQWEWKNVRLHFYEDYSNNNLIILHAFLKKTNKTKESDIKTSINHFNDYEQFILK